MRRIIISCVLLLAAEYANCSPKPPCIGDVCIRLSPEAIAAIIDGSDDPIRTIETVSKVKELKPLDVCETVLFWYGNSKEEATIYKYNHPIMLDRKENCDKDIETYMILINHKVRGKHYVVTRYRDGELVFLDKAFSVILINPDYWCDGLPSESTKYHKCTICGKEYASQKFIAKTGNNEAINIFYANARGTCSNGKNHDNLELVSIPKCPVSKGNTYNSN